MEDRLGVTSSVSPVSYEVDLEKVNEAYTKSGLSAMLFKPLNDEQIAYLARKGLTILQGRLLYLFKYMFDEELAICDGEYRTTNGERIRTAGLNFKSKMLKYEDIAEEVFSKWAGRIGISHLYNLSLQQDQNELHARKHDLYACVEAYEEEMFDWDFLEDEEDEIPVKSIVTPIAQEALHNTSGRSIYERFLAVLKSLQ